MASFSISPEEIEQQIKNALKISIKELQNEDSILRKKILKLNSKLRKADQEIKVHSSFSKAFKMAEKYSYKVLQRKKMTARQLINLQKECQAIIFQLTGDLNKGLENIEYAVYYKNSKGEIVRIQSTKIPTKGLRRSESNDALRLSTKVKNIFDKEVKNQELQINMNTHYQHMKKILENSSRLKTALFTSGTINEGHLAEAFERHLQLQHRAILLNSISSDPMTDSIDVREAWRLLGLSLGKAPWWTGGDVDNVQVKSIFKGEVSIASLTSIEGLINYLNLLTKPMTEAEIKNQVDIAYSILLPHEKQNLDRVAGLAEEDMWFEIQKYINSK